MDPGRARPRIAPDVEIKEFEMRWGDGYAILANPRDLLHYRVSPDELELIRSLDGTRTVRELVVERFGATGRLEFDAVADLVKQLRSGGFLEDAFVDVHAAVARRLQPGSWVRRRLGAFVRTLTIDWSGAHGFVRWLYGRGLRWAFTTWAKVGGAVVAIAGFVAFLALSSDGRFELTTESPGVQSLILLALSYFLTFVHELGHALVLVHHGRRIKSAGFMIYFGSPAFFVDASDGLMLDRRTRIAQAFAGPYAEMIVAGTAAAVAWLFPDGWLSPVLYKFALLNYFVLFLNMIPLLELDGYWILSDLLQAPDLRPMSLSFVRHDLVWKLRHRERFSTREVGLALYGIVGVAFTVFSLYAGIFFWWAIFGGLVRDLWAAGVLTRILLVVLALFLAGPAFRGLIALIGVASRRVRAGWRHVRFRLETGWRIEAARLIDALPLFDDLPEDVLSDLAGRVRLRSFARGTPVFRQGDRAEAFYVVRDGVFHVIEEMPGRGDRVLATLEPGSSFGELGLVGSAPRAATVRAATDGEAFEFDRGTFDRLLSDTIRVPEFGPTVQAAEELRGLPPFARLTADEAVAVLDHGRWVNIPPGGVLMEQGAPGDALFVIGSGRVQVVRDGERVASLGKGDHVGEIALLHDVPRTASVVAVTPVRAFRLERTGFERLLAETFRGAEPVMSREADRTWQH